MTPRRNRTARRGPSRATGELLRRLLEEDRAREDLTSRTVLPRGIFAEGVVTAQAEGVLSGIAPAVALARSVGLVVRNARPEGAALRAGGEVLVVRGEARAILAVERPLLNLLMHLSGVATATARAVRAAGGRVEVRGTRKTTPGLRELEKNAIRHGGGAPHRTDLSSGLLLKNNHLALVPMAEALRRLRALPAPRPAIEVEVRSLAEARAALGAGAEELLLDNVPPGRLGRWVRAIRKMPGGARVPLESSGGITPSNLPRYARTGVTSASLGSLTHSAPALPFHLSVRPRRSRPSR